jgi:hypothetical protein
LGVAVFLFAADALTDSGAPVHLTWVDPPPADCIDTSALEKTVENRLGRTVFVRAPTGLVIKAYFSPLGNGSVVRLEALSPSGRRLGEREVRSSGADCAELGSALPVIIAVLLDLESDEEENRVEGNEPKGPESPPQAVEVTPVPPAHRDARPELAESGRSAGLRSRIAVAVLGEVVAGLQPGVGAGAQIEASYALARTIDVAAWGDFRWPTSTDGSPAVTLRSDSLGAGVCSTSTGTRPLRFGACLGGGAAFLRATGVGFVQASPDIRAVPELRSVVRLEYGFSEILAVRLHSGLSVPLIRPYYGYVDASGDRVEAFRPGAALFSAAGLAGRWQ